MPDLHVKSVNVVNVQLPVIIEVDFRVLSRSIRSNKFTFCEKTANKVLS